MNAEDKKQRGFPVYQDPVKRKIFDMVGGEDQKGEWLPMNSPAKRLCKCLEGLRDIEEAIEYFNAAQASKKRRRRLRGVIVPLHSLCVSVVDLINGIQSEKSVHELLPENCKSQLTQLRERFEALVPFKGKGRLAILRNKVSAAHYDKDLTPEEMREVIKNLTATETGEWISICLGTLCDLLKLNVYKWSAEAPLDNTAVILCENPIPVMSVVDLDIEKRKVIGLRGIYLTTSPRMIVLEMIKEITLLVDSLFEEGAKYKFRIAGFHEDAPGVDWSAMLRST